MTKLNKEEILKAYMKHVGAPLLSEEDKKNADIYLSKQVHLQDVFDALDVPLNALQTNYSLVAKQLDVTQWVLRHKFNVDDDTWDKAEKEVDEANKKQRKELADKIQKQIKAVVKNKDGKETSDKVVPFKGHGRGSND